jgi:hypothetical protein
MRRIFSLVVAIGISWFIYNYFIGKAPLEQSAEPTPVAEVIDSIKGVFTEDKRTVTTPVKDAAEMVLPQADVKLSSLNLKPEHEALLKKVGIDVETFVITKEMMICAEGKVGKARIAEFVAGITPSLTEMGSLIGCLK